MVRSRIWATSFAAPAVSPATVGFQPFLRMYFRHWPSAWMWLWTVLISVRATPGRTMSWKWIGRKYSPTMCSFDSGSR